MKKTRTERRAAWLRKKSPERQNRRRCRSCGRIGYYADGAKVCQQLVGMLGAYRCPGLLEVIAPAPKPEPPQVEAEQQVVIDANAARRQAAQAKLDNAKRHIDTCNRDWNRLVGHLRRYATTKCALRLAEKTRQLKQWEAKVRFYSKRAAMSDAEIDAERERFLRNLSARPSKRGIKIGGAV